MSLPDYLRHQQHRLRQPPAVPELDRRQQRGMGLRRRHPRLHLRRRRRVRRQDWSARYGIALMPTVANGIDLVWNLRHASGQNMEFELRQSLAGEPASARTAKASFASSATSTMRTWASTAMRTGIPLRRRRTPDITAARDLRCGEVRLWPECRAGADPEYCVSSAALAGTRVSTSPSPIPRSTRPFEFGGDYSGSAWSRPYDKLA